MPFPIVTLTTDFGTSSPYVAQMKGVLYSRAPDLRIVDVTHAIRPQDVHQAAWTLARVWSYFPPESCHLCVVDPGVGTGREIVVIHCESHFFVGPNNGIFSFLRDQPYTAVKAEDPQYTLPNPSSTFHGRDIMAPLVAALHRGTPMQNLGGTCESLVAIDQPVPRIESDRLVGEIIEIDSFGNLITNIPASYLQNFAGSASLVALIGSGRCPCVRTYAEHKSGSLVSLIGSHGYLEIAQVNGHAAHALDAAIGDSVTIERTSRY